MMGNDERGEIAKIQGMAIIDINWGSDPTRKKSQWH